MNKRQKVKVCSVCGDLVNDRNLCPTCHESVDYVWEYRDNIEKVKVCPVCGDEVNKYNYCHTCHEHVDPVWGYLDKRPRVKVCSVCGDEVNKYNYCHTCHEHVNFVWEYRDNDYDEDEDDDYDDYDDYDDFDDFDDLDNKSEGNFCNDIFDENDDSFYNDEPDYDSMINDGSEICLNCTYWSVSPYGADYGMVCRRGNETEGPDDSCGNFVKEYHFANYGDEGQYQFNETNRHISRKLNYWRSSR